MDVDMDISPPSGMTLRSGKVLAAPASPATEAQASEVAAAVEASLGAMPSTGGRRKRRGGGKCSDRARYIIKGIVLSALGVGSYYAAPVGATLVGGWLSSGLTWLSEAKCNVGFGQPSITGALCTKYGELIQGLTSIIATVSANAALGAITITGVGTITYQGVSYVIGTGANAVKWSASSGNQLVDKIVDIICVLLYGTEAEKKDMGIQAVDAPAAVTAPAAAAVDAVAAAATTGKLDGQDVPTGQKLITEFIGQKTKGKKGGRKSRSSKRTLKKKRVAKKSTRKLSFRY